MLPENKQICHNPLDRKLSARKTQFLTIFGQLFHNFRFPPYHFFSPVQLCQTGQTSFPFHPPVGAASWKKELADGTPLGRGALRLKKFAFDKHEEQGTLQVD